MPYLTETDFNAPSGELNRAFTKVFLSDLPFVPAIETTITKYVHDQKPRYATFNDVIGALECAKLEYFRRTGYNEQVDLVIDRIKEKFYTDTVAPYEDNKIKEHGDIYGRD